VDDPYEMFLKPWPYIARDADEIGVKIINATPNSGLKSFPIVDPEEVIP